MQKWLQNIGVKNLGHFNVVSKKKKLLNELERI